MNEKVKRLAPTKEVLRELFLKSGNQCAFPGCSNVMMDEQGNFIGQICHIEAAEEGGERFNPNMTNEERRSFDNLMLMCYEHHIITNDVSKYSVQTLKKMKKDHEDKFSGIIQKMEQSVIDYGKVTHYEESNSCEKLFEIFGFKLTKDECKENSKILNILLANLIDLPIETRYVLSIMVERSYTNDFDACIVPLHEIEAAIRKDSQYILYQIDMLKRRKVISEPEEDDYGCPICRLLGDRETGWNYWNDIREFCKKTGISIKRICVDLKFSILD